MNATVKTLLIFVTLIAAMVIASVVYRRTAIPLPAGTETAVAEQSIVPATMHPEIRLALQALEEDREDDAVMHFQAVPSDSDQFPLALQRLAVLLARREDYPEAISALVLLSTTLPDDAEVHATLSWVFYLAERYPEAELAALRVFELDSAHLGTRYNIGLYRVAQNRTQLALHSYARAMEADPNGEEIIKHRDRLASYCDTHPDEAGAHYALAYLANAMQETAVEIEELERYLELSPNGLESGAARLKLKEARATVAAGRS